MLHGDSEPVFLFAPQGLQWPGMGHALFRDEPLFRRRICECADEVQRHLGWSLRDELASDAPLEDDRVQPVVTAVQIALAELVVSRGTAPAAVAGLSMGELAATVIAGVLTVSEAIRIACCEARMTRHAVAPGSMAFVHLSASAAKEALRQFYGSISIAIDLAPQTAVISGEASMIASAIAHLQAGGIDCRLSRIHFAFHSPLALAFEQVFLHPLQHVETADGFLPVYSSLTGGRLPGSRFDRDYWWQIVHRPALFRSTVEALLADGYRTFVEIGPHPILSQSVQEIAQQSGMEIVALPTMKRNHCELLQL